MCRYHGGSAPQVKKKARERLNDLVDPAINQLERILTKEPILSSPQENRVLIAAAKDVLDRTGFKPVEKTEDVTENKQLSPEAFFITEMVQEGLISAEDLKEFVKRKSNGNGSSRGNGVDRAPQDPDVLPS